MQLKYKHFCDWIHRTHLTRVHKGKSLQSNEFGQGWGFGALQYTNSAQLVSAWFGVLNQTSKTGYSNKNKNIVLNQVAI